MNNYGEQINQVINNLAQKLGIAVDKVYPMLRRQATLEGIKNIIWIIVGVILLYATYKILKAWLRKTKEDKYFTPSDDSMFGFKITFIIIASIIGVLNISFGIDVVINVFFNPDYYILQMLMQMIK